MASGMYIKQSRSQLDRLYQRVIDDLDTLVRAVASKPRDSTLKREQNSCYEHDNNLTATRLVFRKSEGR
jgi:hypothetical protein